MTNLSNLVKNGQSLQFKASAMAIAINDLIQIGGQGLKAYPVKTIDYAIKSAVATIVSQTSTASSAAAGFDRQAALTDQFGNIFVLNPASSGTLAKYAPTGGAALFSATTVLAASAGSMKLLQMANGNLACVGVVLATGAIWYSIYDTYCNQVLAPVNVATGFNASTTTFLDACTLTAGGFALVYLNSAGTQMTLRTYDNSGTAVLGATNVQTFGGTPTLVHTRLSQLTSGNLLVSFKSSVATPAGMSFVVVTTAGVSIKANTVVDATAAAGFHVHSVMSSGFFAIAGANGTNMQCAVYSDAGTLQGGNFTGASTQNTTTLIQLKLINDGVQFWLVHVNQTNTQCAKIPTTGTGFVSTTVGTASGTNFSMDAALQGALMMVYIAASNTGASSLYYVQLPDAELPVAAPTQISSTAVTTAAATTGTFWPRVIFNGDFTAVLVYDKQNVAGTFFAVYKVDASAIEGVSQTANAVNSPGTYGSANTISVNVGPGSYLTNYTAGTSGKGFSHSSAAMGGNNGKIFNNSVALVGVGVQRNIN